MNGTRVPPGDEPEDLRITVAIGAPESALADVPHWCTGLRRMEWDSSRYP
ncbi:hypothetical protein GCM10010279_05580 [Streptomyces mutabilis]|nr:hypothetical protein GCM10010279_05580 [Streptomyces mutabilis]